MIRCWFHRGESLPCPRCIASHAEQRAEDEAIVGKRRVRADGPQRPVTRRGGDMRSAAAQSTRRPGYCFRGHPMAGNRTKSRDCLACARIRRANEGTSIALETPVPCSVCGVEFVREFTGQKRCGEHMRAKKRKRVVRAEIGEAAE